MAKIAKKETECRQKQAARNMVDMEHGVFPFPDGTPGTLKDGTPRIVRTLAFTTPGQYSETMYSRSYLSTHMPFLMEAPYFKQQYALFKHERDTSLVKVLESAQLQTKALDNISVGLLEMVVKDLQSEEPKITPRDALKYAAPITRLAWEVQGKLGSDQKDKLAVVLMNLDETIPDPEERRKIMEGVADASAWRRKQLEEYKDAGDALDRKRYSAEDAEWEEA